MSDNQFRDTADEVLGKIQQMADNIGSMDEHRAINYLALRFPGVYNKTAEMQARSFSLAAVDVIPSRLSGTRKLVNVILAYTNRTTDVTEKYYVRVDVTDKFPFLVQKLAPFVDRETGGFG